MTDNLRVLAISGSLRKASFNTALMHAAIEIAKAENLPLDFETADIREIPLYDDDLRAAGFPAPVTRLREAIAKADGVLFVSPEYNYSVPGVLKNAIDWASRAPAQPFDKKPIAMMGASGAMSGTMRMQYHLRQIAVFLDAYPMNKPEVFIRNAKDIFDAELHLKDEPTRKVVADFMGSFAKWIRRMNSQV